MDSILIADAGSTKTKWVEIKTDGNMVDYYTDGFNPAMYNNKNFVLPSISNPATIKKIHYYGSGVIGNQTAKNIYTHLIKQFPQATITIESDLLAAARSGLGKNAGGIGILGTGSNSAYYDGEILIYSTPSLGFILGDEGGGVDIGKRIIRSYFYQTMPSKFMTAFDQKYQVNREKFLSDLKIHPYPSKFLASFTSFLTNVEGNWKKNLLLESFNSFFVLRQNDFNKTNNNIIVGSIAEIFRDELNEAASKYNITINKTVKDPINGLIKYHIQDYE